MIDVDVLLSSNLGLYLDVLFASLLGKSPRHLLNLILTRVRTRITLVNEARSIDELLNDASPQLLFLSKISWALLTLFGLEASGYL